jgi:protein-tyrosine phosphatase
LGAPSPAAFDAAYEFIEAAIANEGRVYIHCRAGMERTAAIVVAWFARRHAVSYDAAFANLKARRPILNPLPHQERAARAWLKK